MRRESMVGPNIKELVSVLVVEHYYFGFNTEFEYLFDCIRGKCLWFLTISLKENNRASVYSRIVIWVEWFYNHKRDLI